MVEFKVFVGGLLGMGSCVDSTVVGDALFNYKLPVERSHCERIKKSLCKPGKSTVAYNGYYYRVVTCDGGAIYSNAPFNVCGFTGDEADMGVRALTKMLDDIQLIQDKNDCGGGDDDREPYEIAFEFAKSWCYQSVAYIREHLCYGLFNPLWKDLSLTDTDDSLCIWDSVLNNAPFEEVFVQADDLTRLPGMLNFKKILNHFERAFLVAGHNTDIYKAVSNIFVDSFMARRRYKTHDVFVCPWRNDFEQILFFDKENPRPLAICDTRIDEAGASINRWMHGFNCALMDSGEHALFSDFLFGFCDAIKKGRYRGKTYDCGDFKVRFCEDHLNITIAHNCVTSIERFLAKYNFKFSNPYGRVA